MANRRLPVRKIKEILCLKHACGLSKREIARSCNVAPALQEAALRFEEALLANVSNSRHNDLHRV